MSKKSGAKEGGSGTEGRDKLCINGAGCWWVNVCVKYDELSEHVPGTKLKATERS